MSITIKNYPNYSVLAEVFKEKLIFYKEYGSYSGDWILITAVEKKYKLYINYYGSCSGCDFLQDFIDDYNFVEKDYGYCEKVTINDKGIEKLKKLYSKPFIVFDQSWATYYLRNLSWLESIFPKNIRYTDITEDLEEVRNNIKEAILKYEEEIFKNKTVIS